MLALAGALVGGFCIAAAWIAADSRLLSVPIGAVFAAVFFRSAYNLVVGGRFELTIDWKSVCWGWRRRTWNVTTVHLSDVDEALFWYDDTWRLWIVLCSGKKLHVPTFFDSNETDEIRETFRLRGIRVREATSMLWGRPH